MRIHPSNLCSSERWVCRCFKSNFCAWPWWSPVSAAAKLNGLKVLPVDVMESEWKCTVVNSVVGYAPLDIGQKAERPALRLGLRYVRGLREEASQALVRERNQTPFTSIHDLVHRVPELRKDELNTLAEIGALNSVLSSQLPVASDSDTTRNSKLHRRDALWQVERAVRYSGPLLEELPEPDSKSPLERMNDEERLVADFRGTGLTVGPHPMAYHREQLQNAGVCRAIELKSLPNGRRTRIGGCVIARQRPGTAKGFVFLSLEDETGVANAIINPDLFQKNRLLVSSEQFLMIEGILQNQDNVISVKAERVLPLAITQAETVSHDFY